MSRRFLLTLFAALLLLLCAGVSGVARAAVVTMAVVAVERSPLPLRDDPAVPADVHQGSETGVVVELADASVLPGHEAVLPLWAGRHRPPSPVLDAGHPAPCLDGLLRPPCLRA